MKAVGSFHQNKNILAGSNVHGTCDISLGGDHKHLQEGGDRKNMQEIYSSS
jgi:hypothetical protein